MARFQDYYEQTSNYCLTASSVSIRRWTKMLPKIPNAATEKWTYVKAFHTLLSIASLKIFQRWHSFTMYANWSKTNRQLVFEDSLFQQIANAIIQNDIWKNTTCALSIKTPSDIASIVIKWCHKKTTSGTIEFTLMFVSNIHETYQEIYSYHACSELFFQQSGCNVNDRFFTSFEKVRRETIKREYNYLKQYFH